MGQVPLRARVIARAPAAPADVVEALRLWVGVGSGSGSLSDRDRPARVRERRRRCRDDPRRRRQRAQARELGAATQGQTQLKRSDGKYMAGSRVSAHRRAGAAAPVTMYPTDAGGDVVSADVRGGHRAPLKTGGGLF